MRTQAKKLRQEILRYLIQRGPLGATDQETWEALDENRDSVRPRRGELCKARLVVDSGHKRKSHAGNPCIVWVAQVKTLANLDTKQTHPPAKPTPVRPPSPPSTMPAADPPSPLPTMRSSDPKAAANPLAVALFDRCGRCESTEYEDFSIHNGQSTRRDCAQCHWTFGFPLWYGRTIQPTTFPPVS